MTNKQVNSEFHDQSLTKLPRNKKRKYAQRGRGKKPNAVRHVHIEIVFFLKSVTFCLGEILVHIEGLFMEIFFTEKQTCARFLQGMCISSLSGYIGKITRVETVECNRKIMNKVASLSAC
jgi:hypothetical protein